MVLSLVLLVEFELDRFEASFDSIEDWADLFETSEVLLLWNVHPFERGLLEVLRGRSREALFEGRSFDAVKEGLPFEFPLFQYKLE